MRLNRIYLISLTVLVAVSLSLIVIGGSISAWCVKLGQRYECHSLFYSRENFSCLFKLVPTGVIICLSFSLLMFVLLIVLIDAKKEYQLVARFVNVFVLSLAIVLIMIVLLQWFHPPSHATRSILIAKLLDKEQYEFSHITSRDPSYLTALELERSLQTSRSKLNHGPNLFFAAFVLLLCTLIIFIILHRVEMK